MSIKFSKLKKGDFLSETQFYTVSSKTSSNLTLKTDGGNEITIGKSYAESLLLSDNQFDETVKMSRTELTEKVLASSRVVMTVNFNKKVKDADVVNEISNVYDQLGIGMSKADFKKKVKAAMNLKGEERTMRGRHYGTVDPTTGRLQFIDMEQEKVDGKDYDTRQRQVDPRTLNWAIIAGVKYIVK